MKKVPVVLALVFCLGLAMTVQSAGKPTGVIKVPVNLILELKVGNSPVPVPSGKDVSLPADTYTPASITAQAAAAGKVKPELWSIKSTGPFGKLAQIEVKEGCTSAIDAGPPFTLKALVSKAAVVPGGKVVSIGFTITGKAGEVYSPSTIKKGQSAVPAPQVQILDEKGNVLAQGTFAYG
jgi:hypothetical protein